MRHINPQPLALPLQVVLEGRTNSFAVDIAPHSAQRLERFQLFHNRERPKIAGMPNLIAFGEIRENRRIEKPMRIRHQPNPHPFIKTKSPPSFRSAGQFQKTSAS